MAPHSSAGLLAISCPWHQAFSDQPAIAGEDFLPTPIGYVYSMKNSNLVTAQVKAHSRIFHWATLVYESTHYHINNGSSTVNTLSYKLHPRLQLVGRSTLGTLKALIFSDEKDCCRWVWTRNSG